MRLNSPVYKKPAKHHLGDDTIHGEAYAPLLPREGLGEKSATRVMFTAPSRALHPVSKFRLGTRYSELWKTVWLHNLAYENRIHPFSVALADFLRMSLDETRKLQAQVGATYGKLLQKEWREGMKQVVICDGEVVYRTSDEEEILSDIVREKATARDKPCYAFSAPDTTEESSWTQVRDQDFYPTLDLQLSPVDPESESQPEAIDITADFDTGNQGQKCFSADQIGDFLGEYTNLDWVQGDHPHGKYRFVPKKANLSIKDEDSETHGLVCTVRLVENWESSALKKHNPNRQGFIGRDLLRLLDLGVELNPVTKRTKVFHV